MTRETTDTFQKCDTFAQAMEIVKNAEIVKEIDRGRLRVIVFSNAIELAFQSEHDGPISSETPDFDWEMPTIWWRKIEL